MATIFYEGLPTRPDAGIWWSLVEKYKVTAMFSAPTAVRVLKKQDPALPSSATTSSSLRALFLAGEPLDEPTGAVDLRARSAGRSSTTTGRPNRAGRSSRSPTACRSCRASSAAPGLPMYGYDIKLLDEHTGEEMLGANQKGVVAIEGPLPPGCMQTVWRDDARFVDTYWKTRARHAVYSTFDWAVRDEDGYFFILGRTDDVINVAGHRLGTREIEESISGHAERGRGGGGRRRRSAQGPGRDGLRRRQGRERARRRARPGSSSRARS